MLIEAAHRNQSAAKEMVAITNCGGVGCEELREALEVAGVAVTVLLAFQVKAASLIAKMERHGDGGTGVLAEAAGVTRRDARGQVEASEAISAAPSIRDAVEQGRVSQANARWLADVVKKTSADAVEADAGLLAKAASLRPEEFAKEARRWAADRQDDGGEREYQRLRSRRKVHVWNSDDGTVQMHGVFDPVTGRRIGNRLKAEARHMYEADKKHIDGNDASGRRTFEQCMADALDNLTSHATTGTGRCRAAGQSAGTGLGVGHLGNPATSTGPDGRAGATTNRSSRTGRDSVTDTGRPVSTPTNTSIGTANINTGPDIGNSERAEADAGTSRLEGWDSGWGSGADQFTGADLGAGPHGGLGVGRSFADISVIAHVDNVTGELIAELPDGARLPSVVLEELACNARLTGLVYDTAGTPIWRVKSSRTATEGQRRVLLDRWGGCFHCAADPDMCQIHHIVPVSRGGATKIDNMVPVCWDCHNKIHHHRWRIRIRPDGRHSLHPPNHTNHGSAHAPEQPLLFTTS